ncbi:MAG: hypothetical protein M5U28_20480 [Sandaracinaceae bacterium]|nr:hypothetical protein [Sandaracinaceae bacterium]
MWAIASVRTALPLYYAFNDTRTPVIASAVNLVVFAGAALALLGPSTTSAWPWRSASRAWRSS